MSATTNQPRGFFGSLELGGAVNVSTATTLANPAQSASLMWNTKGSGAGRAELVNSRGSALAGPGVGGLVVYDGPDGGPFAPVWSVDSVGNVASAGSLILIQPFAQQDIQDNINSTLPIANDTFFPEVGVDISVVQASGRRLRDCVKLKATLYLDGASDDNANNSGIRTGVIAAATAPGVPITPVPTGTYAAPDGLAFGTLNSAGANFDARSIVGSTLLLKGTDYDDTTTWVLGGYWKDAGFANSRLVGSKMTLIVEPTL